MTALWTIRATLALALQDRAFALLFYSVVAFALAAAIFVVFPGLDIAVAGLFHETGRIFVGKTFWVEVPRYALQAVYVVSCVAAIAALIFTWVRSRSLAGLNSNRWLFLVLALAIGPGLVANVLLKNQIGRARPHQTELFGGNKAYAAPLTGSLQCKRNCSFVSGEASSMFALFFALSLVVAAHARVLLAVGLFAGALAGLIRISQGAHFLSDIVFAGIFMAMTVSTLYLVMREVRAFDRRFAREEARTAGSVP